jgi:hypothetical protein
MHTIVIKALSNNFERIFIFFLLAGKPHAPQTSTCPTVTLTGKAAAATREETENPVHTLPGNTVAFNLS